MRLLASRAKWESRTLTSQRVRTDGVGLEGGRVVRRARGGLDLLLHEPVCPNMQLLYEARSLLGSPPARAAFRQLPVRFRQCQCNLFRHACEGSAESWRPERRPVGSTAGWWVPPVAAAIAIAARVQFIIALCSPAGWSAPGPSPIMICAFTLALSSLVMSRFQPAADWLSAAGSQPGNLIGEK